MRREPVCPSGAKSCPNPNSQPTSGGMQAGEGKWNACPQSQQLSRGGIKTLRFLDSMASPFPAICTYPVLKGIKANLVLRNNGQRILPCIIRHPWGCHQSWARWPASQPEPSRLTTFQREDAGGAIETVSLQQWHSVDDSKGAWHLWK